MGLFSWLFKRKKTNAEENSETQRHFLEERISKKKSSNSANNILAEKQITIDDVIVEEAENDEKYANDIICATDAKSVKIKGLKGSFDVKRSKDDRYVFNLYAANKIIIATSRVYSSAQNALSGIASVISNAERASIEDQSLKQYSTLPFPKWEIYIDKEGKFRFRLRAINGTCILRSQGYTQKSGCKNGIESVIKNCKTAKIDKSYLKK